MRKKLLGIQNELLKGISEDKGVQVPEERDSPPSAVHASGSDKAIPDDQLIELLKAIRTNQQTMIQLLSEINGRLGT